ncbi:cytochrome c biogenesis protein ResB [Paenibacillus arenilitoris]|uniref:Cytochrome c biogenesis protein ResB n=1 Tax=Paenibacillus arenilitoris TaxID=2772299 RepID=A0A927H648_9BACL|nr:cytochrome c biogenesis protein ResB [Paenibacillus arenilitoris]MBD2869615.1 cytochrome c biogenesis protein ResB [Paenibacillus arenilitoris]
MVENTKCECGHQNAVGTVLCESCGKPLDKNDQSDMPLEMRYDGVARRSQKTNPNVIDRVWNFFSSVKIAIYLIVLTFLTAMLGTIYPQENTFVNNFDPSVYYEETYGLPGKIYYLLGLTHTYESWWFIGLLVMIGTSLVICSLDRVLPLYRALNKQQIRKHHQFILRQKTVFKRRIEGEETKWADGFAAQLKRQGYRIHRDGTALLAEKNRFSRWGPYINHIGLILFLLAVLARSIPSWQLDTYITVPDGDTVQIADTNYYVKNEKFTVEYYKDEELPDKLKGTARAKLFETKAVLYECVSSCGDPLKEPELKEVKRHDIVVNEPLKYKGLKLYQFDFDTTPRLNEVRPVLVDKQTGDTYGPFDLPMKDSAPQHKLGPFTLDLYANYMEFSIDENGEPVTLSRDPVAPAFIFTVKGPGLDPAGEPYLYFPMQKDKVKFSQDAINAAIADKIEIRVDGMENVDFSEASTYLNVRMDRALPYVWIGAAFSMLGLLMGSYWQHRRIWLRIDQGELALGAHTNKNWYGMRSDVAKALGKTGIAVDPKSLDNGGNNA